MQLVRSPEFAFQGMPSQGYPDKATFEAAAQAYGVQVTYEGSTALNTIENWFYKEGVRHHYKL